MRGLFKNIWTPVIGKRLKENSKTSLVCSSSDSSERRVVHELLLEPKDHTHQVTVRCAITFARAKSRNDLILADFNLAVGWSIRQTANFNSPPNFPAIRYNTRKNLLPMVRFVARQVFICQTFGHCC